MSHTGLTRMWLCQNWVKLIAESFQGFAFSRLSVWSFVQGIQGEPWPGAKLRAQAVPTSGTACVAECAGADFREAPLETRKNLFFLREKSISWVHQARERAFAGLKNS